MRKDKLPLTATAILPDDQDTGALVGRVWLPAVSGPSVVAIRERACYDITSSYPTISSLAEDHDPATALRTAKGVRIDDLDPIAANTPPDQRDPARPWLLASADLQVVKAAGVTFVVSMLERVIEERHHGAMMPDSLFAQNSSIGIEFSKTAPLTDCAAALRHGP